MPTEQNQFLALLEQEQPTIKAMLPEYIGADRWWALAYEMSRSGPLRECAEKNPGSLIAALKKLADWGLELDGEEAVIIPYWDAENKVPVAEAQAMYKGLIRRAIEAGVAAHIYAEVVRDGDVFRPVSGSKRDIHHEPDPFSKKKVIGAYAVAMLANGVTDYELFSEEDIAAVKAAALRMAQRRKKDAGESPAWRFYPNEMIKKSVIRRLCKRLRGKRDTDAGRRYGELLADERRVDPDPIDRIEPPIPGASDGTEAPTPRRVTPEVPPKEDRLLTVAEQDETFDGWVGLGGKKSALSPFLQKQVGVDDLAQVKLSQLEPLNAAMAAELAG